MMDKELKAKWVGALRSGEFKQLTPGMTHWKRDGKHCCLGVLGELLGEQRAMAARRFSDVLQLYGESRHWYSELIDMNDGLGRHEGKPATFAEIADYIEKNL